MSIFAIIPTVDDHQILDAINTAQLAVYKLPIGQFLVSYHGTSKELSDLLGITDGTKGQAVIIAVGSYFGRTTPNTWEWLKANWGG